METNIVLNKVAIQEKLMLAVENSMDGIALLDSEGKYYFINQVHISMFGYSSIDDFYGKTWRHIYGNEEIERIEKDIFPKLIADSKWHGETVGITKDGNPIYQEITLTSLPDGGIICICRDISEKKNNNELLKLYEQIIKSTSTIVMVTNAKKEVEWTNDAFTKISGYTLNDIIGKNPGKILQGVQTDKNAIQYMQENLKFKNPFSCEVLNYKKNGDPYWIKMRCEPLFNELGEIEKYFALQDDITQTKLTEKKLRENDIRLQSVIDGVNGALWDWDIKNEKVSYSSKWKSILGYSKDEISTSLDEWSSRIHPDDFEVTMKMINDYLSGNINIYERYLRIKHKNGNYLHWLDRGVIAEKDENGYPTRMIGFAIDISELKEIQNKLAISEQRWNFAIEGSGAVISDWDIEKNNVFYSPRIFEILNVSHDISISPFELLKQFVHPDDTNVFIEMYNHLYKKSDRYITNYRIRNKQNTYIWVEDIAIVLGRNNDGYPKRILHSFVDITERKHTEIELLKSKEFAESLVLKERRFLTNISHELRTPLHAVIGLSEQLANSPLNSQQKEFVVIINEAAQHLQKLISDVLDLSKISEGKLQTEEIPFSFHKILQTILMFDQAITEKGLTFRIDNTYSKDNIVLGDPLRVKQIIINILSNAVKFTQQGYIEAICIEKISSSTISYKITIKDTGIGIDEKLIDEVFGYFIQEDKTFARRHGGSGLGLSITKELVKMIGGEIQIQSKKNEGTSVTLNFIFPKYQSNQPSISKNLNETKFDTPKTLNVLLADDNYLNRLVAKIILNNNNIYPEEVENGKEVLDKLKSKKLYDIILLDIQMSEMDGVETIYHIRQTLNLDIPVIAITANAIQEELDSYIIAGMNDYITKPFDEKTLIDKIYKWCDY